MQAELEARDMYKHLRLVGEYKVFSSYNDSEIVQGWVQLFSQMSLPAGYGVSVKILCFLTNRMLAATLSLLEAK